MFIIKIKTSEKAQRYSNITDSKSNCRHLIKEFNLLFFKLP